MATYVRTAQAPWWGNLAANLGTTILGGLWNEWQQREKNKKTNAYQGELLSQLQELGGLQDNTQSQETGLLNTPMPEGYNSDGWANSFHKTDTPLTQFDLGTAPNAELGLTAAPNTNAANAWANLANGINPLAQFDNGVAGILGANAGQQAQARRTPTALEIYNTAMKLAATDRFRSMNPDTVQNILTPYLKLNEEARQEQRRQEAADAYINAGNDRDMLNQLYRGAIQGTVPEALLGRGQDRFYRDNPDLQTLQVDSGDSISILGRNARTNELRLLGEFGKSMSPYERAKLNADIEQKNADRQFEYDKLRQENQAYQGTVTDADGVTWLIRKGGGRERVSDAQGLSEQQKERLKNNAATLVNIRKKREGLEAHRRALIKAGASEDEEKIKGIDAQLKGLDGEEQRIQQENDAITNSRNTGNGQIQQGNVNDIKQVGEGNDIGANMLGIRNPTITTLFNAPRKKKDGTPYGHRGTDYAAAKDTPIRLDDVGTTMTVTKVANDPDGYGNYVTAQAELTGSDGKKHTIGLLWAHMGNGTINVKQGQELKFGDLIGKVGNTGNSRGKNGGYHLHLETTIDGKRVDPLTFKKLISPYIPYSKTTKPNTFTGTTPIPKVTVMDMDNNTAMAYRNPMKGQGLTQKEVEEFERRADNGELPYARNRQELHDYWRKNGYVPTGNYNTQNQGQTASGDIAQNPQSADRYVAPDMDIAEENIGPNSYQTPQHSVANAPNPDLDNEAKAEQALAALNGQFNTWDNAFRNRYPLGSQSDFWRV